MSQSFLNSFLVFFISRFEMEAQCACARAQFCLEKQVFKCDQAAVNSGTFIYNESLHLRLVTFAWSHVLKRSSFEQFRFGMFP